jgi:NAD(P)-dependent dehydrogenase (short-subunit alcohol dehydrogenase family)
MSNYVEQLFSIEGKTVIVTGASRGIGGAIAEAICQSGSNLVCMSRSKFPENTELQKYYYQCDIKDSSKFKQICEMTVSKYGSIDIFINSAGVSLPSDFKENDNSAFEESINVNLVASYKCLKTVSKYMVNGGSIINITSIGSMQGFPDNPGYVASKGGLRMLTKSLAIDLSSENIRVNNIVPGYISTDMTKNSRNDSILYQERLDRMIIKRWGLTEDIVGAVIYLASNASSYVTGIDLVVDGGWIAKGL